MIENLKKYTSRERVLLALNHKEADRVPIDLGSTMVTGIMAHPLDKLRRFLKLNRKLVKVYDIFQMLGEVEEDLINRFEVDILPVRPITQSFNLKRKNYKLWNLWDGTSVLVPGEFKIERDKKNNLLIHINGDIDKPIIGRMPKNGFYFDMNSYLEYKENFKPPRIKDIQKNNIISTEELDYLGKKAAKLRKTDKALILDQWQKIGINWEGSIFNFLELLFINKKYVKDLFKMRTEVAIENLEKLKLYLNDNIDIICLEGNDYGGQDREFFSVELFEEIFFPYLKIQNQWIHNNTKWKTFQHSCGSIINLLPMIIDSNVDILNPIQTSAKGMDPLFLKKKYGKKIVFWGGGVDTQDTLPFKSPDIIAEEVKNRIKIFSPGGGFIFSAIHNIQQNTPPENIVSAFDTVRNFGFYNI